MEKLNPNKVWFTSDTHFGHSGIIKFCDRPFESVDEMNQILIDNWNSVIPPDGIVFHLGDFSWNNNIKNIICNLNGNIVLIKGNHDNQNLKQGAYKFFLEVHNQLQIQVGNSIIYLNHYPFLTYGGVYKEKNPIIQCFGHIHMSKYKNTGTDTPRYEFLLPSQYDVGVDLNDFKPISYKELKERIDFQIQNKVNCTYWINHESNRNI
jgi:calcineurin-like phosphoesterase family protein